MRVLKERFRPIIRARATVLGITLTEVSKRLGMSRQQLNSILRDMRLNFSIMVRLAEALEWRFIDLAQAIDFGCIINDTLDPEAPQTGPDYMDNVLNSAIGGILAGGSGVTPTKKSGRRPRLRVVSSRGRRG